nr:DUF4288 domain-containing protein [Petropleomorpha daqingensis]
MAVTDEPSSGWYAVRCVFAMEGVSEDAERTFEERVTLWRAESHDEAIDRAETEARDYATALALAEYVGLAQSYQLPDAPDDGVEVFSLLRDSDLAPSDYLDAFFDTGTKRQQKSP